MKISLILSHLFNFVKINEQSHKEINDVVISNSKTTTLFDMWLKNIHQDVMHSISTNVMDFQIQKFSMLQNKQSLPNQTNKNAKHEIKFAFPSPKVIHVSKHDSSFKKMLHSVLDNKQSSNVKCRKNLFSYVNDSFSLNGNNSYIEERKEKINKVSNQNKQTIINNNTNETQLLLNTIIEQPSREEREKASSVLDNCVNKCQKSLNNLIINEIEMEDDHNQKDNKNNLNQFNEQQSSLNNNKEINISNNNINNNNNSESVSTDIVTSDNNTSGQIQIQVNNKNTNPLSTPTMLTCNVNYKDEFTFAKGKINSNSNNKQNVPSNNNDNNNISFQEEKKDIITTKPPTENLNTNEKKIHKVCLKSKFFHKFNNSNTTSNNTTPLINHPQINLPKINIDNTRTNNLISKELIDNSKYSNSSFMNSPLQIENWQNPLEKMNKQKQIIINYPLLQEDKQYQITDCSDNENDEESIDIDKKDMIPKWAEDKRFIEQCIFHQNNSNLYTDVFGVFKIEQLNLNMIFHCDNEKYEIRHSTADWRKENTVGNKPKDVNNGKENHMKIKEECLNSNNKLKF